MRKTESLAGFNRGFAGFGGEYCLYDCIKAYSFQSEEMVEEQTNVDLKYLKDSRNCIDC